MEEEVDSGDDDNDDEKVEEGDCGDDEENHYNEAVIGVDETEEADEEEDIFCEGENTFDGEETTMTSSKRCRSCSSKQHQTQKRGVLDRYMIDCSKSNHGNKKEPSGKLPHDFKS
eukprot:6982424-Ditylum_brightwellii.AAC.1